MPEYISRMHESGWPKMSEILVWTLAVLWHGPNFLSNNFIVCIDVVNSYDNLGINVFNSKKKLNFLMSAKGVFYSGKYNLDISIISLAFPWHVTYGNFCISSHI